MKWNWQSPDWPEFRWNPRLLTVAEERFLRDGGVVLGSLRHMEQSGRDNVLVDWMSDEALTTSAIEGEVLSRSSVQSSVRRQLGLATDPAKATPAETGVAEMMVALYRSVAAPLDEETLCAWHAMLMRGRTDLERIGGYRTHASPMRIVSGRMDAPDVHFEAPPSSRVRSEMRAFLDWFQRTAPSGDSALPSLTRAGLAHIHFESIHPFEDGNGRLGRAISEKALSQGLGAPTQTALSTTILRRHREYYELLRTNSTTLDVDGWTAWFAGVALEAQRRTQAIIEFLIDKSRLLDRLRGELNPRQEKVLLRVLAAGPDGFVGGLSAANFMRIAKTSPATATRDLGGLVDLGAFTRSGERRHTRYHLAIPLRPTPKITIDPDGNVVEENRAG